LLPQHEGAKCDTIGVTKRVSPKLQHHKVFVLVYSMENETPFVHHIIEWQGCGCIVKDDKSLNEKTQGHPKMKPKPKLMRAGWEQGKVFSQDSYGGLN
jgi:hypothetical protein